jgi:hypothetical protein
VPRARFRTTLVVCCLSSSMIAAASGQEPRGSKVDPADHDGIGRRVQFSPGVLIDWGEKVVELDAAVVLRQGMLELFACSPHTREHESIVVVQGRPLYIFQAMGLIGLEPGAPVRYDEEKQEWLPAHGERLKIDVRYVMDGRTRTVPLREWLYDVAREKPPPELRWVFAGSGFYGEDKRFMADLEGTIITVVNFGSALIALDTLHSDANAELWLSANTEKIPARGTKCTLLIRSASREREIIEVHPDGRMTQYGVSITPQEIVEMLKRPTAARKEPFLLVRRVEGTTEEVAARAIQELVKAGLDRNRIRTVEKPAEPTGETP